MKKMKVALSGLAAAVAVGCCVLNNDSRVSPERSELRSRRYAGCEPCPCGAWELSVPHPPRKAVKNYSGQGPDEHPECWPQLIFKK